MSKIKMTVAKKIRLLAIFPIVLIIFATSIGGSVLLGGVVLDEVEKQFSTAVYSIQEEMKTMNALNSNEASVNAFLEDFKENTGIDVTIFNGNVRRFSTLPNAVGTFMDNQIWNDIQYGENYFSKNANENGVKYYAYYVPFVKDGQCLGAYFVGEPASRVDSMILKKMGQLILGLLILGVLTSISSINAARKISQRIEALKQILDALNDNDLTQSFEKNEIEKDDLESLKNQTLDFLHNLTEIIQLIKSTSTELDTIAVDLNENTKTTNETCNQISQAVENVANGATSQAEDTQNITDKISTMGEDIEVIKTSANTLLAASADMTQMKDKSMKEINNLECINNDIMNKISTLGKQINITNASVENIQNSLSMIKEITAQTKLLSLNASIEAAHAGSAGRGFTVVAEEIGKLAHQSDASSEEIAIIIQDLLNNYKIIIDEMTAMISNLQAQNQKINETKTMFLTLEQGIDNTANQINTIDKAVNVLNTEKEGIIDAVCNLSAISQENSASSEETMASIEELNSIITEVYEKSQNLEVHASDLMDKVDIFKTK